VPSPDIAEQLRRISAALKPLKVRWYVFGAQAVIAAGAARATADIDITTEDVPVERLRAALAKAGFTLRKDIEGVEELIEHHRILPLEHASGLQLDVVRAGPGPEQEMMERLVHRKVGRARIPFISTDDLLVLKVLAGRDKDLEDVRALLRGGSPEIHAETVRARLATLEALLDDSTLVPVFETLRQEADASRPARRKKPPRRQRR
jgi:hypothetical protein